METQQQIIAFAKTILKYKWIQKNILINKTNQMEKIPQIKL